MSDITIKFTLADWGKPVAEMSPEYQAAIALRAEGKPWKIVTAETGVGYASGWLAEQRASLAADQVISVDPANPKALCDAVKHARLAENNSWGTLMVRTGLPETQVRRAFELATNVFSEGLRNGKGGRFLANNAEAYAPAPKVGWVRKAESGAPLPAEIVAGLVKAGVRTEDVAELGGLKVGELRAMAEDLGLDPSGKKADLINRLAEALA